MVRGKKGFERILWAFKNVLVDSLTWLFHDLQTSEGEKSGPDPMGEKYILSSRLGNSLSLLGSLTMHIVLGFLTLAYR